MPDPVQRGNRPEDHAVRSFWQKMQDYLLGQQQTVQTPHGPIDYQQGGVLGRMSGGPGNLPLVGPVSTEPMTPVSAIHETAHGVHGAGYDLINALKGDVTPPDESPLRWRPSEVYAYTSQPANLSHDDLRDFGVTLLDKPDLLPYYLKFRNPNSDWPTTREGFRALGFVNSDEALQRALAARGQQP